MSRDAYRIYNKKEKFVVFSSGRYHLKTYTRATTSNHQPIIFLPLPHRWFLGFVWKTEGWREKSCLWKERRLCFEQRVGRVITRVHRLNEVMSGVHAAGSQSPSCRCSRVACRIDPSRYASLLTPLVCREVIETWGGVRVTPLHPQHPQLLLSADKRRKLIIKMLMLRLFTGTVPAMDCLLFVLKVSFVF